MYEVLFSTGQYIYKVFARTGSMYMEFWLALGNVYKVLMATIEHPSPMSWAPQDSVQELAKESVNNSSLDLPTDTLTAI